VNKGARPSRAGLIAVALLLGCHPEVPAGRAPDGRIDVLARQCARIASCAHAHDPPRLRDPIACVEDQLEHAGEPDAVSACLARATSCGDVEACLHPPGDPRAAALCAAHPGAATGCDGDSLYTCAKDDPAESTLTPCAPLGAVCGEARSPGGLVTHGCLSPSRCAPDAAGAWCDGETAVLACHDQILERTSCKPGAACRAHVDADGEALATCEGAIAGPCEAVGQRSCRGGVLVRCEAHGHHAHEASVDCEDQGLRCVVSGGRAACLSGATPCAGGAPRCEKGTLVFCVAGKWERVACSDLGLGPCETEQRGVASLCSSVPR
jgi:hypothetical protein